MSNVRVIRGRIKNAVAEGERVIRCSVLGLAAEQIEDVELFNDHGSSSVPLDDSECVAIQFGHRTIVIAGADRRIAPAMDTGDVAIHTGTNQYVILKNSGGIEIRANGDVTVYGDTIKLGGETLQAAINGIVTKMCTCSFAGMHTQASTTVMAKG